MLYQIKQYIKFLIRSTNQHGVHSPFVYQLITKCFYNKTPFKDYKTLSQYRKKLYQNHKQILVTDFGSGSRVFKTNQRRISKIAKTAGITNKRAKLLYRLTNYLKINNTLELGTSVGLATSAISLGNKSGNITTIEGCTETAKVAKQEFQYFQFKNITVINNQFTVELNKLKNQSFDLIYIDGNHNKEATLQYFEKLLQHINNDSVVVFDDINWSRNMQEAWQIIKQNPKVTVSIDTFFWGIVFFRKEQKKEHFTIRL